MTRVRLSHTAHDGEYDLVDFTEGWPADRNQRFVLRGEDGVEVTLEHVSMHDGAMVLEVQCDSCGRWRDDAGPAAAGEGWRCYGGYGGLDCPDEP